jgi:hypothetical protein
MTHSSALRIQQRRLYTTHFDWILRYAITERSRLLPGFLLRPTPGFFFYTYILCETRNEELILDSLGCLDSDLLF